MDCIYALLNIGALCLILYRRSEQALASTPYPFTSPRLFCSIISITLFLSSLSKYFSASLLLIYLHSHCMAIHRNNTHTRPQTLPTLPTPINSKSAQPHTYVLSCTVLHPLRAAISFHLNMCSIIFCNTLTPT